MALSLLGIHHVDITVPKAVEGAARHFYGVILGMQEIPKPAILQKNGGAWFEAGRVELHVAVEEAAITNGQSKRHVCYLVEDLAAAEQHLRDAGIVIVDDRQPIAGWTRFYVRDPGGNRIEIAQLTP